MEIFHSRARNAGINSTRLKTKVPRSLRGVDIHINLFKAVAATVERCGIIREVIVKEEGQIALRIGGE